MRARWSVVSGVAVLVLLGSAGSAHGVGGTDSAGCYAFSDTLAPLDGNAPTYSFTNIAGSGTQIFLSDDQTSNAIPIGFTFNFYGSGYTNVHVSSNGFLTFLPAQYNGCCTGSVIPDPSDPNGIVAGWWEDLLPGIGAGTVNYQTIGSAPNRTFIVQFGSVQHYPSGTPVTFQFKLLETSNEVEVHYASVSTDFGTHSAGIENATGTIGAQWKLGASLSFTNTAVRYFADIGLSGDGDSDGVADCIDNCPSDANPGQEDADSDGIGDLCDPCAQDPSPTDVDGDGFCSDSGNCPSGCDNCPFTFNSGQEDTDSDGLGDSCDNCPAVPNPSQDDSDFDGLGDACDVCVGPGTTDTDGDGICDSIDNCPNNVNPGQEDSDFDGFGDACDTCPGFGDADSDGDSLCDQVDNCPNDANPGQEDEDFDGIGDACDPCGDDPSFFDFDSDGFCSDPSLCPAGCDNCPFDSNPGQEDADSDGLGDACDNCPADANPDQEDADLDGDGDVCDPCFGAGTTDTDSDGLCDGADPCPTDPTQACATLYGCTGTGGAASALYRINPMTGVGAPVGPMGMFGCSGLAFDPTDDVLYAVGFDAFFSGLSLFTVDPTTGTATVVGPTNQTQANDIAFRADGVLFSYHRPSSSAGVVSTATGSVSLLGPSGFFANGNGITFDQDGDLLHAGATHLRTINQTTGAGTIVSPLSFPPVSCGFPRINSMAAHDSGVVYGVMNCSGGQQSDNYLVTIGVPSGSVSAIGPSVPGLDGIAFALEGVCGDGMRNFGEDCDDGNTLDGDCCSAECEFESAGQPCPGDGSPCTIDECDGSGSCASAPPSVCKQPGKSILLIKKKSDESKDKLVFKWLKGPQTDVAEYGDPLTAADYALCLYTGPAQNPFFATLVPADGVKWAASTKGFKYKDTGGGADGVTGVLLKSGDEGRSKALVKGKGAALPLPSFGNLPMPVKAQLVNSETNACFEATYVTADVRKNDAGQFKAKSQ